MSGIVACYVISTQCTARAALPCSACRRRMSSLLAYTSNTWRRRSIRGRSTDAVATVELKTVDDGASSLLIPDLFRFALQSPGQMLP